MKYKKKVIMILCVCLTIILLSSCRTCPPSDVSEEIASYIWISKNEQGECRLALDGKKLQLQCVSADKKEMILNGKYFADENTITVEGEDFGTVVMKYSLKNEKLTIDMYNMSIIFTKENAL